MAGFLALEPFANQAEQSDWGETSKRDVIPPISLSQAKSVIAVP